MALSAMRLRMSEHGWVPQLFEEGQPCTMLRSPGTPGFTAPECLTEDSYDGRAADMWALGISLYMLLTGRLPHQTNQISQLYKEIQTQEVRVPEFPEADAFLQGLLAKDPRERLTAETALQHPWVDHTGADRWEDSDSHSVRSSASGFGSARSDVGQGRRDHTDELDGAETLVASV
jgi:serine/threonine protein kinase